MKSGLCGTQLCIRSDTAYIYDIIPMLFFFVKNTHNLQHPSQSVEKKENQISVGTFSANDDFTTVDYLVIKLVKEVTKTEDKT